MDVFGIAPRLKLQEERIALAENVFDLSVIEVEREVSRAWAQAYATQKNYRVYQRLDTIFKDIERAARLRLEVEATSRLEYLATSNQGNQVQILKEQAYRDYLSALQRLNLWFVSKTFFNVPDIPADQLDAPLETMTASLDDHPLLNVSKQQVDVADATIKERKAQFLPKFNLMYGLQQITGQSGDPSGFGDFNQFQVGIQIPLFFGPELGSMKSAKKQRSIAAQNLRQTQQELNTTYQSIREQYTKWLNSWRYYQQTALPMALEQQEGAVFAYQEGAIDYVTFLQNMREAIRIETDSWNAFGNYLDSRFQLEYFLKTSY